MTVAGSFERRRHVNNSIGEGMKLRTTTSVFKCTMSAVGLGLLTGLVTVAPIVASGPSDHDAPARLVQAVRDATRQFIDVNNADRAGTPALAASAALTTGRWAFTTSTVRW